MSGTKIVFLNLKNSETLPQFELYRNLTPNGDGQWKSLQAVTSIEEADYYIISEVPPQEIGYGGLDCSKIIYFQGEPAVLHKKALRMLYVFKDQFFAYFDYQNYRYPTTWFSRIPFSMLDSTTYRSFEKQYPLSCLMSTLNRPNIPGHQQRIDFLSAYIDKYPLGIHVYGRGQPFDGPYRGELAYNGLCNSHGFSPYHYTLICENSNEAGHITDRINDCLLNWSIPIYYGGSNVHKWYPEEIVYTIDVNDPDDIGRVHDISQQRVTVEQIIVMAEMRQKIIHEYNIFEKIYSTIEKRR